MKKVFKYLIFIKKKYDGDLSDNVGNSIDVHMSWINEENK